MAKIRIVWPADEITADLKETPTAKLLLAVLPCKASASTWGDEVYFSLPVKAHLEPDAQQVVDPGTVCFWVEGNALALPFGPTPISKGDECRLASKCNLVGKVAGDPGRLRSVRDGDEIRVERA
jgi:hypothetical protein